MTVKDTWPDGTLLGAAPDGEPDASPYAGHRVRYDYDARGRLTRRLHEGVDDGSGVRPFIELRELVWEGDRLAAEAAYGAPDSTNLRWRRTYVPGPAGLDDPPQVAVEIQQPGSPFSGTARTYTYLRDELGTVVGLVAEDDGADPANPPVPLRYRYTPYGEAHAETGPELLRARFDGEAAEVAAAGGTVTQVVPDPVVAAAGALVLDWSLPLDAASLGAVAVEELVAGARWTAVDPGRVAIGGAPEPEGGGVASEEPRLVVLLTDGWTRGRSYRVRLAPGLADRLGRPFGRSESLEWSVPAAGADPEAPPPPVVFERRFPTVYETFAAAGDTAGGRFPAGQSRLFQGLWTDPVTGTSYARARWYDPRNGVFLTEDPMDDVDSPNLYAFVAWMPSMSVDHLGLQAEGEEEDEKGLLQRFIGFFMDPVLDFITGVDRTATEVEKIGEEIDEGLRRRSYSSVEEYLEENPDAASASAPGLRQISEATRQAGRAAASAGETLESGYTAAERAMIAAGTAHIVFEGGKFVVKRTIAAKARREAAEALVARGITLRNPSSIRFSQDSIGQGFKNPEFGTFDDLAEGLRTGRIKPGDIEPIRLVEREGHLITIDNRRLQAFRDAGVEIPTRMATREEIAQAIRQNKFTAGPLGSDTIRIRGRR